MENIFLIVQTADLKHVYVYSGNNNGNNWEFITNGMKTANLLKINLGVVFNIYIKIHLSNTNGQKS